MRTRVVYLVLDGAAGNPSLGATAFMRAQKPGLDRIAREGVCGLAYTIARGVAPESDAAVLSILGYDPDKYYPGRGPLEALGAGMELGEGQIALRGNFATVEPGTGRILDRRVGRSLGDEEGRELAASLDGMELDSGRGRAWVRHTVSHRLVVVMEHEEPLSPLITNTDPAYERRGLLSEALPNPPSTIQEARPMVDDPRAALAARLVNEFTRRALELLRDHPVNLRRRAQGRLEANAVLLRDAGAKPKGLPPFQEYHRLWGPATAVVEMPVEKGIARLLGMEVIELRPPRGDPGKVYRERLESTLEALRGSALVYVHLKGPDEPGHDGNADVKSRIIGDIDEHFVRPLIEESLRRSEPFAIAVTSDHATPCPLKAHSGDPVPLAVWHPSIEGDTVQGFTEGECARGSLGVVERGHEILPRVMNVLRRVG